MLLRKMGLSDLLQASTGITLRMEFMHVFAVVKSCLNHKPNLMQVAVGLVFMKLLIIKKLMN